MKEITPPVKLLNGYLKNLWSGKAFDPMLDVFFRWRCDHQLYLEGASQGKYEPSNLAREKPS